MKAFITSLFFICTLGANVSWGWSISVKGEGLDYQAELSKKTFDYKDAYLKKTWAIKPCNKKVFEQVVKDFHAAFKKRVELKGKFPNKIVYQEDKKSWTIAQNSIFGVFLTQFPNRIISLVNSEEQACKPHKK